MITKEKGNIGEAIVLSEFVKRNIQVAIPFGDCARYDLIADFNGKLNKIQVKYCGSLTGHNSFVCQTSSSKNHTTNKCRTIYADDVDYIACYIVQIKECILIPIKDIEQKKTFVVRIEPPKNNQTKGIHLLEDYRFDNVLGQQTHNNP